MIDSLRIGGAQKLLVTFAREARRHDLRCVVVSLKAGGESPLPDTLRREGAVVFELPPKRLLDFGRLRNVVDLLRQERVSVLQTHLTYSNVVGAIAAKLAGVPVISTLHTAGTEARYASWLWQVLEDGLLRLIARRVIAVGQSVARKHNLLLGSGRVVVIPNAVDTPPETTSAARTAVRRHWLGDEATLMVVAVGRLSPPKGYENLLEAFALARETVGAKLLIVGDGLLRGELETRRDRLALKNDVIFAGTRDDVQSILPAADLFVSASHWEGMPLAVLEAMMAQLPILATAVGDVPQVVPPEAGVIVEPRNAEALGGAMRSLLQDPARLKAMGQAAAEHARRNYNSDLWFGRLRQVYDDVRR